MIIIKITLVPYQGIPEEKACSSSLRFQINPRIEVYLFWVIISCVLPSSQVEFSSSQDMTTPLNERLVVKMANIEALRKSRKTERAAFTKPYNRFEELITLKSVDICELEAELNVFKGKVDRISLNFFPRNNTMQNLKL
ncbi:hypothetical protein NPIL_232861 [Nephila pilipes]|uniref:Uncharacterized protein n=1 Tax=Nephila pilipes TaxID=299642 RepID=A0A8X6UAP5_NEPPI|nr:hypothetical protein NPIL_232861 [Nephila pilipes]